MELTVDDIKEMKGLVSQRAIDGETVLLNMGPQHPSTHGVLRLLLELDGETVISCIPDIGYLHTGIEKSIEDKTYTKAIPLTDRMDYLSPMSNNLGYVMAVEKLMEVEVPLRAQYVRVILCELQRISSHLVWLGTHAIDLAAMSVFLYCFREREKILDIFEMVSGQRMMVSYFRVGGLWRDLPTGFEDAVRAFLNHFPEEIDEYDGLLKNNPLWIDRTKNIGVISAQDAINWGVTGASLRGSGVNFDIRKALPYSAYDHFDFDIPTRPEGDVYARFW
ncbi:MAG TPA: NADH-quinone oxidoreductase subunit D, partial [Gemmatimonadaceae bacterium]|nr:NADH-quinone oxidoreductase subunit D [Gemmatimonadaceae bacterium]